MFLFLLLPLFAPGQERSATTYAGRFIYYGDTDKDTIDQITILNPIGQTIFNQTYRHDQNGIRVNITDQVNSIYIVKINSVVVGQYACTAGKILFDAAPGPVWFQ